MLISGSKDRHKTLQRNAFALLVFLLFPLQDFVITLDSNIYFVPQTSLLWMGIVELGHWCLYSRLFPINLSVRNLLCLKIHFLKNHHLPPSHTPAHGMVAVLFCPCLCGTHCIIGKPTLCGCEITTSKTSLKTSSYVLCHPTS